MAKETTNSEEFKISSYNSAGNTIKRLDSLWESAHRDVRNGNYLDWNILLDRLWLEISGDLDEENEANKKMEEINTEIIKLLPLSNGSPTGFNKKNTNDIIRISKQYLTLRKKEMLVKKMENKLGLGKAYVDEFEDDWD